MNNTAKTYTKLGKQYLDDIADLAPAEREEFIRRLPRGSAVLDVGCAGGRDSGAFVESGFQVVGIDLVGLFLSEARKRVPAATFRMMDVCKLDFPDESFNAVWANAILMHVPKRDTLRALKELQRVCKPSGLLLVRVKHGQGERAVADKLSRGVNRLFSFFTEDELSQLSEQAGFTVESAALVEDGAGRDGVRWVSVWAVKR
ncbi:MAG: class I SAM-dependent methyltransferase [Patescibacteria group bacterium]